MRTEGQREPAEKALIAAVLDPLHERRPDATEALARGFPSAEALPAFWSAAASHDASTRAWAVRGMHSLWDGAGVEGSAEPSREAARRTVDLFERLSQDPVASVRTAVASGVRVPVEGHRIEQLVVLLGSDEDPTVVAKAVESIGMLRMHGERVQSVLAKAAGSADPAVRARVAYAVERTAPGNAQEILLDLLEDEDPEVLIVAARAVHKLDLAREPFVDALGRMASSPHERVRDLAQAVASGRARQEAP